VNVESRAAEILSEAERQLRQLTAEAAAAGDYTGIIRVAGWAKAIHDLTRTALVGRLSSRSVSRTASVDARVRDNGAVHTGYPRFFRRGAQLVRIAWSKREKKEYQHKAPYIAIKVLADAIASAGKDGHLFKTEEVLPIRDANDGSEIPNYQAYVCIAWLKHTGLIDQHGRQGYSVPRLEEFLTTVESTWRSLPEH
jgi:hypothetical protein